MSFFEITKANYFRDSLLFQGFQLNIQFKLVNKRSLANISKLLVRLRYVIHDNVVTLFFFLSGDYSLTLNY